MRYTVICMNEVQINSAVQLIRDGKVGVIPTDTIHGISAKADDPALIEQIYRIKGRPHSKPFVILINDVRHLNQFGIKLSGAHLKALESVWPGPVSAILPCPGKEFEYLHRGRKSLAFRLPKLDWLRGLIAQTGPIIATSANLSGETTHSSIEKIKQQLPGLDFYLEGEVSGTPSKLVILQADGSLKTLPRS
jgi:L-threonylcarbamoyladenylate synthase